MSRLTRLYRLGEEIESNASTLAGYIAEEAGSTVSHAQLELGLGAQAFKTFDREIPAVRKRGRAGKVAIILPYNSVGVLLPMSLGAAYLGGNEVEIHLSGKTKKTAALLEGIVRDSLGKRVSFNHEESKGFLTRHFSNDTAVIHVFGHDSWVKGYEAQVRKSKKKFIFEGPGKDPCIILNDADLDTYARTITLGSYANSGQVCMSLERYYVHEEILPRTAEALVEITKTLNVGDPRNPATDIGPIMSRRAIENIVAQLEDATQKGAQVLSGGTVIEKEWGGTTLYWVTPTILTGVTREMKVMTEETFGPLIPIQSFKENREALAEANGIRYALGSSVFGDSEAEALARELRKTHGFSLVNSTYLQGFDPHAPWGGFKDSGWIWETAEGIFKHRDGPKQLIAEFTKPSRGIVHRIISAWH